MNYGDCKYISVSIRTASDKALSNEALNIVKNPKYDWYQRALVLMVYKRFDKRSSGGVVTRADKSVIKSKTIINLKLSSSNKDLNKYAIISRGITQSQLLLNLKIVKYTHLLETIFEVFILEILN